MKMPRADRYKAVSLQTSDKLAGLAGRPRRSHRDSHACAPPLWTECLHQRYLGDLLVLSV